MTISTSTGVASLLMPEKAEKRQPTKEQRSERVVIPLDSEKAPNGLLRVDPESEPVKPEGADRRPPAPSED
jgi:hypothetical protein